MSITSSFPYGVIDYSSQDRDAFGLARVGQAMGMYENKNLHNENSGLMRKLEAVGGTVTYLPLENQVELAVTAAAGSRAVRQSPYSPYIPGNAHRTALTGVLGPIKAGNVSRIGKFDDNNGGFFERNSTDIRCVIRSSVSGSPLDTLFFTRDQWEDKFDGNGTSRKIIDFSSTRGLLFVVEIAWQGYVGVRFGIEIDGRVHYCKTYYHNGVVPFIATPTLPARYEIYNTANTSGASSMKECCLTDRSEGGGVLPGMEWSVSNFFGTGTENGALVNIPATTVIPIPVIAVRMAPTFNGKTNRRMARLISSSLYAETNPVRAIVYHVHSDYTATVGGSWVPIHADGSIEVNTGITSITGGTRHPVHRMVAAVGVGNASAVDTSHPNVLNYHGQIQNNLDASVSEMFVIFAARTTAVGAANVSGGFDLIEIE